MAGGQAEEEKRPPRHPTQKPPNQPAQDFGVYPWHWKEGKYLLTEKLLWKLLLGKINFLFFQEARSQTDPSPQIKIFTIKMLPTYKLTQPHLFVYGRGGIVGEEEAPPPPQPQKPENRGVPVTLKWR